MPKRYGPKHRAERKFWSTLVNRGDVRCARCGFHIAKGQRWHLDHAEDGGYLGPSHARCNLSAGAVKTNKQRAMALRAAKGALPIGNKPAIKDDWFWNHSPWSRHWYEDSLRVPWCPCSTCSNATYEEFEHARRKLEAE
jgi:hypothetical protein